MLWKLFSTLLKTWQRCYHTSLCTLRKSDIYRPVSLMANWIWDSGCGLIIRYLIGRHKSGLDPLRTQWSSFEYVAGSNRPKSGPPGKICEESSLEPPWSRTTSTMKSAADLEVHLDPLLVRRSPWWSAGRVRWNLNSNLEVHCWFKFDCYVRSKSHFWADWVRHGIIVKMADFNKHAAEVAHHWKISRANSPTQRTRLRSSRVSVTKNT